MTNGMICGLAVVTLILQILSSLKSERVRCRNLILGKDIGWSSYVCDIMVGP